MNQTTTRNSALIKLVSFVMMLSIALYFGAAVAYASDLDLEPSSGNGGFSSRGLSAVDALALETLSADGGKIVQVSLNVDYSSALKSDGSLWMWGLNDHGQLGDGTTTERHVPVKVLDGVTEVSLGSYYTTAGRSEESVCTSAAIKADGSLWMWGYNGDGQVGDGSTEDRLTPVKVLDGVAQVDLHYRCSAAIKTDGSLWTWGSNGYGQLGDGTTIDRHSPVKVMDGVAQVSIGYGSAVIKTDGSLWTWGYNGDGQVGDGSTEDRLTPVKVMEDVSQVCLESSSPLSNHYAVVKTDGSLWTWGSNEYGELGDGTTSSRYTPVKVMEGVARVSLGDNRSSALKSDGSFWTWGSNGYGYLGDGTTEDRLTPVKIMENVVWASTTSSRSAALKSDGSLWAWGDNRYGQVGDGMAEWRYEPVKVMEGVAQVSLGLYSCAAIKSDGSLWTWGANYEGYLGDGTTTNRLAPVCIFRGGEWLYGSSSATQPATDPTPDPIQPRVDGSTSKKSIEKASVSVAKATYDGTAKKPKVTVSLGGKALKVGTDYKVTYSNNVNASSKAVAKVTGINKYKGSVSKKFKIAKHPMDKAVTATFPKSEYAWTGKAIKPEPKVCFNGKKMKKGTDYKINYYLDNKNVGHASVMVSGKGNFENKGRLFGFDIVKAQQPIKLDKGSLCFRYRDIGKTVTMAVSGVKEKASVNVTSSKTKVATVKKSGGKYVITLKGVGITEISAQMTKATKHYAKTTKTIEFTVVDDRKDSKIKVDKLSYVKSANDPAFNLSATCNSDMPLTYSTNNKDIATVSKNGEVTLNGKEGKVTITLSVKGSNNYKPSSLDVTVTVNRLRAPIDLEKGVWGCGSYDGHPDGYAVQTYATDWHRTVKKKDASAGMPVYAMADGTIRLVNPSSGSIQIEYSVPLVLTNGYKIKAKHWYSWYGHMKVFGKAENKKIDNRVEGDETKKGLSEADKGKKVKAGEIVGYIGKTSADNYHLHFSVFGSNAKISSSWSDCKPISPYWIAGCGLDNDKLYPETYRVILHREYTYNGKTYNLVKDSIPGKAYWEKKK